MPLKRPLDAPQQEARHVHEPHIGEEQPAGRELVVSFDSSYVVGPALELDTFIMRPQRNVIQVFLSTAIIYGHATSVTW